MRQENKLENMGENTFRNDYCQKHRAEKQKRAQKVIFPRPLYFESKYPAADNEKGVMFQDFCHSPFSSMKTLNPNIIFFLIISVL